MARKTADEGVVSRLAGRGEDAMTRLMDELGRNSVVTDALARAMSAKGRLDSASRATLGQVGLAASDDVDDLDPDVVADHDRLVLAARQDEQPALLVGPVRRERAV